MKTQFLVIPHPYSKRHLLLKVITSSGRVYASPSAWEKSEDSILAIENPKPTPQTVQYHWKHNRHDFLPYNESSESFVTKSH